MREEKMKTGICVMVVSGGVTLNAPDGQKEKLALLNTYLIFVYVINVRKHYLNK